MKALLVPHRLLYSPQNSPGASLCAEVVYPGKDFLILGHVWEGEGTTVFSFSSMAFSLPYCWERDLRSCVVSGLERHTLAVCHFHCTLVEGAVAIR